LRHGAEGKILPASLRPGSAGPGQFRFEGKISPPLERRGETAGAPWDRAPLSREGGLAKRRKKPLDGNPCFPEGLRQAVPRGRAQGGGPLGPRRAFRPGPRSWAGGRACTAGKHRPRMPQPVRGKRDPLVRPPCPAYLKPAPGPGKGRARHHGSNELTLAKAADSEWGWGPGVAHRFPSGTGGRPVPIPRPGLDPGGSRRKASTPPEHHLRAPTTSFGFSGTTCADQNMGPWGAGRECVPAAAHPLRPSVERGGFGLDPHRRGGADPADHQRARPEQKRPLVTNRVRPRSPRAAGAKSRGKRDGRRGRTTRSDEEEGKRPP